MTGNLEKAYQTLELWLQTYPRGGANGPPGLLGGLSAHGTGRFERIIEGAHERIAADPGQIFGYSNLATGNYFLGRFDEAEGALQRASERGLQDTTHLVTGYTIAVLKGDTDQMERIVALAKGKQGAEHAVANAEALALARSGRLTLARQSSSRAIDLAGQAGEREVAARYQAARAVWEAVCGNAAEGERNATAALALSNGRDVEYAAGLALAFSGDSSRSQALADDLEQRFPEDTFARFTYVPVLRALSAAAARPARRQRRAAANRLALRAGGERPQRRVLSWRPALGLCARRGVVGYRAGTRKRPPSSRRFSIIEGSSALIRSAHWRTCNWAERSSCRETRLKAKSAYQDFLTLWKDADPDIPILSQAKAEFAKLQ